MRVGIQNGSTTYRLRPCVPPVALVASQLWWRYDSRDHPCHVRKVPTKQGSIGACKRCTSSFKVWICTWKRFTCLLHRTGVLSWFWSTKWKLLHHIYLYNYCIIYIYNIQYIYYICILANIYLDCIYIYKGGLLV